MNKIDEIVFIYDTKADICLLREGKSICELTIKDFCEYQAKLMVLDFKLTIYLITEFLLNELDLV